MEIQSNDETGDMTNIILLEVKLMRTFYITGATVAHNFTSQQQAGHTSHQSQSRHASTHQRYTIVFIDLNYILNYYC